MTPKISARGCIKYAWGAVMAIPGKFMAIAFITLIFQFLPIFFQDIAIIGGIIQITCMVIGYWIQMGFIIVALKVIDGKSFEVMDIFPMNLNLFLKYIGTMIVFFVIVFVGFLLLIIPGLIWGYKYALSPTIMIDKNVKVMDAIRSSGVITYGYKWKMFQLMMLIVGINILGFICLGVGLLITMPMSAMAMAKFYRSLPGVSGSAAVPA